MISGDQTVNAVWGAFHLIWKEMSKVGWMNVMCTHYFFLLERKESRRKKDRMSG